ncbi:L-fuconolactonase [Neolewinella xylanilytica]|uniref:L-fuconolactonase n=1 Tax=Neolewinella xylanilytica TaxID=1514080 RepID=A0A2S6I4B3_9BACT|nr:amidohydrolase family protein [Neolewinella xylanilytica]PPK85901.1 L-fuconolactonase [Neolewinella xylanilytica]
MTLDAHQHFWNYDPVRDAWIDESMQAIRRDFLPPDLQPLLADNGIDGCIAIQADQSLAETDFLLQLARQHSFIRGVVGWVDLCDPGVKEQLERYDDADLLVGMRHVVQAEPPGFMDRPDFRRGISALREFGLTYDILIYHHQLAESIRLVAAYPDQPFVLDHLAKPVIAGQPDREWRNQIESLAGHEQVYCKLSGMVTEVHDRNWTPQLLQPYIEVVLEAFGPERVMYGSDWPVCLVAAEYSAQLRALEFACAALSESEKHAIFGKNAAGFYGIGNPSLD